MRAFSRRRRIKGNGAFNGDADSKGAELISDTNSRTHTCTHKTHTLHLPVRNRRIKKGGKNSELMGDSEAHLHERSCGRIWKHRNPESENRVFPSANTSPFPPPSPRPRLSGWYYASKQWCVIGPIEYHESACSRCVLVRPNCGSFFRTCARRTFIFRTICSHYLCTKGPPIYRK